MLKLAWAHEKNDITTVIATQDVYKMFHDFIHKRLV